MKIIRCEDAKGVELHWDELTPEELAEAYRLGREAFTAADLAKYCNIDENELVDGDEFLADLEEQQRQFDEKKNGTSN